MTLLVNEMDGHPWETTSVARPVNPVDLGLSRVVKKNHSRFFLISFPEIKREGLKPVLIEDPSPTDTFVIETLTTKKRNKNILYG